MASYPASGAAEASAAGAAGSKAPGDLAGLQNELKAAKEKWEDVKLGKAKKECETFPFPVWVMLPAQQPPAAKAFDVYELPVKLLIDGLEQGQLRVEVPSKELPPQLQDRVAEAVLGTWRKQIGKKAAPWGILKTLEWIESNFAKLLSLDPDCLHPYEGCDENDCSMRRYAIGPPAAPVVEEEDEEDSEDEDDSDDEDAEAAALREKIASLLAEAESGESSGRKKLSPEEIERRKKEAEEMGTHLPKLSKKELEEQKPKVGKRLAKTGQKARKFEGEGSTSKEDKKKKNKANVAKRFGLTT
eukprot:TRINITY_DN50448_c0_g1_i1.p1 TRINITY_DN50448_c0_g1~~TRINITY_DN50448_c0_g1_i1.p1  ORF type:complete len:309 (-),score=101.42 TRINITY_DN50448_c0_g1_i1:25-927(-)